MINVKKNESLLKRGTIKNAMNFNKNTIKRKKNLESVMKRKLKLQKSNSRDKSRRQRVDMRVMLIGLMIKSKTSKSRKIMRLND